MISIVEHAPRIALIGCGAIAEKFYLPALVRRREIRDRLVLVDASAERAAAIARRFGIARFETDYQAVCGAVDGAIVATPHAAHYAIARELLAAGCHVLCEKPLTETHAQGAALVELARQQGCHLLVNNTRRLFPTSVKVKSIINSGVLGPLRSIRYHEGGPFAWPTATGFYFSGANPRGVLLDRGAHALDLLCWWLGGRPRLTKAQTDSFGGPEGVAWLNLDYDDCQCDVRMSWLSKLANKVEIVGERGRVSHPVYDLCALRLELAGQPDQRIELRSAAKTYNDLAVVLIDNFVEVIAGRAEPLVPASAVLDSLAVLETSYAHATRFDMPWENMVEVHA